MNLLPHKSWNIWSSKNIAKIERDEAAFEKQQREEQLEKVQRQRDSRLEKLRKRVRGGENKSEDGATTGSGHVGLFEREERQAKQVEEERNKNKALNSTIKNSLKDNLKVPWYASKDGIIGEAKSSPIIIIEEQDPLVLIKEWEAKEKAAVLQQYENRKDRKRKRKEDKSNGDTESVQHRKDKREPSFIRLDKNTKWDRRQVWDQLRTKQH